MRIQEVALQPLPSALGISRILVPVDFSSASNHAVEQACRISGLTGAELIFLHVMVADAPSGVEDPPGNCGEEAKPTAPENLRALVDTARSLGAAAARSITRCGLPTHEIVEEAKESDVDLIVIASHDYTRSKDFCVGSTAERVVRAAPCSVLVVRENECRFPTNGTLSC